MNNELGALHKFNELWGNLRKLGFTRQKVEGDAVHLHGAGINFPLRMNVLVIVPSRDASVDELHAANLDDTMPLINLEPRGFGIQYNLPPIHWLTLSPYPCPG